MRVLLIEDDPRLADAIRRGLDAEGMAVDVAPDGEEALWRAAASSYRVIVLDVMLPGIDGVETCRRLRDREQWTPVLLLTARTAVEDRVNGLNSGADDYLVKPFSFEELLARVRALARREQTPAPTVLQVGDLRLDASSHQAWRRDQRLDLTAREVAMLEAFMRRPRRVLSRLDLLELVWHGDFDHRSNVVDVAVRRLRDKIDRPFGIETIQTIRGAGYRLCDPSD